MAKAPRSSPPRSCGLNAHARPKVRFGLTHDQARARTFEGAKRTGILVRRPQPGRSPLHRIGLGDEPVDVIAVDALKRAHLESDARGLNAHQDHWTRTLGTDMGPNCYAACVEQDCYG